MNKLLLAVILVSSACGSVEKQAPPPEPKPEPEAKAEAPLPRLSGDDRVPDRFRTAFGRWLRDDAQRDSYQRVVSVSEVSNAVAVVLDRKFERGGSCLMGPSTLSITENPGADASVEVQHFGEDCCPGTTCQVGPEGWNLRYLKAVADKDNAALAALFSAKKKLSYQLTTPDGGVKKKYLTRKEIAAGKFVNPPGCGFTESRPHCDAADAEGAFQCTCEGGGYHVTYSWVKEGQGAVIVQIAESSH